MAARRKTNNVTSDGGDDGRWVAGFLAEENHSDRRTFWRLGAWGVAAVAAVALAATANRFHPLRQRDPLAATDLAAQSRQWRHLAQDAQSEVRRLSSAVDTLNADRDRLYARVTSLEQNLDSVTGSIARRATAPEPPPASPTGNPPAAMSGADGTSHVDTATAGKPVDATAVASPTPEIAAPATTVETPQPQTAALAPPSPPLLPKLAILAPPDASAMRLEPPDSAPTAGPGHGPAGRAAEIAVPRTTFGIDLGGATTLSGLRALWRRTAKANKELADLHPIVAIQERARGRRLNLRLLAGPFGDAAEAAKLCAILTARRQPCATSVFDGQRLALDVAPAPPRAAPHRRAAPRPHPEPPKPARPAVVQRAR